ncbi:MAG: hypothetical protein ACKVQT_03115 [Burkholderiales bacterium]
MKRIGFDNLFDRLGTADVGYCAGAAALDGEEVEIKGYLSPAHDGTGRVLLVDAPGACPDCSPAPVAAIQLPGFTLSIITGRRAVRLRGRIGFGFAIDTGGNGSFLRLAEARVATGMPR